MKFLAIVGFAFAVASCLPSCIAPKATPVSNEWEGTPNPLDEPGATPDDAAALHRDNVRIIQGIAR